LIKSSDLEDSNAKLKDQIEFTKKPVVKEEGFERGKGYQRPQSAFPTPTKQMGMSMAEGFNFAKEDNSSIMYDDVVDEMDRELEEMLQKGQKSLQSL